MPHSRTRSVQPAHRETLPSFLARLAASKGLPGSYYAGALHSSLRDIASADRAGVEALAQWGKLTDEQAAELASWTGERIGDNRMRFRGEVFVSRALRNPVMRGCPACLRDGFKASPPDDPLTAVLQGLWQCREAVVCIEHQQYLVPLWHTNELGERYDVGTRLSKISAEVSSGALDQPAQGITN